MAAWRYAVGAFGADGGRDAMFGRVLSGYESVRPLTPIETAAIPYLAALRHVWLLALEIDEHRLSGTVVSAETSFYVDDHSAQIGRLLG